MEQEVDLYAKFSMTFRAIMKHKLKAKGDGGNDIINANQGSDVACLSLAHETQATPATDKSPSHMITKAWRSWATCLMGRHQQLLPYQTFGFTKWRSSKLPAA
jgi:hypothetical protein